MATQKKFVVKNGLIASGLTYPTADGTAGQSIVTDAAGNLSFGTSSAAETLTFTVKNNSGSTLVKGTVVYVSGLNGNTPEVSPARANSSSTMPAFGLVTADILDTQDGTIATFGSLKTLNIANFGETSITFGLGDTVYVSASEAGKLTNVAPTGESHLIQNIGKIIKSTPTSNMTIKVGGAGRTNQTPALNDGNIFIGDSNHVTTTITLNTTNVPEGTNLYYTTARFDSDFGDNTTSDLTEGSNLYYTNARADARVNLQTGSNLDLSSKSTSDLSEGSNLYYTTARFDSDFGDNTTSDLTEGTNLYYTDARFDTRLATKSTTNLSEGTNLYYTTARFDSDFGDNNTDDLTEGSTNLYYTNARADARVNLQTGSNLDLSSKSTSDLSEGSNLYYTNARADARVNLQTGSNLDLSSKSTSDLSEGSNLYYTTTRGDSDTASYISGNRTYGNITTTGYLAGPATFTIDPAAVGDNTGTVVIAGNLQVDGTTTTINSTTLTVDDLNITLASGAANAAAANGAGITVDTANASITYDATNDEWDFNKDINVTGNITVSGTVDGVDIATRDAVLTSTTTTANAAMPTTGGTFTGGVTFDGSSYDTEWLSVGHWNFRDGTEARFGNSDDLKIYHDGSDSYIKENGTGNLNIDTNGTYINLQYGGTTKLAVQSTGIDVTGNITVSGTVDGVDIATNIPTSLGTAGQVLTVNAGATAGEWADAAGGADLYAANESSPTAQPSATGANAIAIGDSTSSAAAQSFAAGDGATIANTGTSAVALGTSYASGSDSFAAAIGNNTSSYGATNTRSIALGYNNRASGYEGSVIGGNGNSVTTSRGFIGGGINNTVSANNGAIIGGENNTINSGGLYSVIIGGERNETSQQYTVASGLRAKATIRGQWAHASGLFANTGDAQASMYVLRSDTTDATPEALTATNTTAGITNQIILQNESAMTFTGTVVVREDATDGDDYAGWEIKGVIMRQGTAADTTLGVGIVNSLYHTAGLASASVALSADTTNGGLKIEVTGIAATNLNWVATVHTSEVVNA